MYTLIMIGPADPSAVAAALCSGGTDLRTGREQRGSAKARRSSGCRMVGARSQPRDVHEREEASRTAWGWESVGRQWSLPCKEILQVCLAHTAMCPSTCSCVAASIWRSSAPVTLAAPHLRLVTACVVRTTSVRFPSHRQANHRSEVSRTNAVKLQIWAVAVTLLSGAMDTEPCWCHAAHCQRPWQLKAARMMASPFAAARLALDWHARHAARHAARCAACVAALGVISSVEPAAAHDVAFWLCGDCDERPLGEPPTGQLRVRCFSAATCAPALPWQICHAQTRRDLIARLVERRSSG